jgi:putative ABC transport system ATP-binding protein
MQNETSSIIMLFDVTKSYGFTQVLRHVNLSVNQGEFVSIRGKSGVGKTSLFKILSLLETPTSGQVQLFGKNTAGLDDNTRANLRLLEVGLVFQFFNLLPTLTVQENIELPMALAGTKKPARIEQVRELLAYFDLVRLAERYPENLSGGERQRVAIMRALVNNPKLLLADEPTSSLDDENAELLNGLLADICREKGVAVVVTSTDLYDKLPTVCDYVLRDGVLSKM